MSRLERRDALVDAVEVRPRQRQRLVHLDGVAVEGEVTRGDLQRQVAVVAAVADADVFDLGDVAIPRGDVDAVAGAEVDARDRDVEVGVVLGAPQLDRQLLAEDEAQRHVGRAEEIPAAAHLCVAHEQGIVDPFGVARRQALEDARVVVELRRTALLDGRVVGHDRRIFAPRAELWRRRAGGRDHQRQGGERGATERPHAS